MPLFATPETQHFFIPDVSFSFSRIGSQALLREGKEQHHNVYGKNFIMGTNQFRFDRGRGDYVMLHPGRILYERRSFRCHLCKRNFQSDRRAYLHHMQQRHPGTKPHPGRIESHVRLFNSKDSKKDGVEVVVKYIPANDKELDIMMYLNHRKVNMENILLTNMVYYPVQGGELPIIVGMENSYRVPIVMHRYNGDLLDFCHPHNKSFHNYLKPHQIMLLGDIVAKTFQRLIEHDLYYTDTKPANLLYHWLRSKSHSRSGGQPFNVVLTDLGGILKAHRGCPDCKTNHIGMRVCPKCRKPLIFQHRKYLNAQTYPYPTEGYDPKNYGRTHESRHEYLEKVVVWGLGILLLQMSLRNPEHQRQFSEIFSHTHMTYDKYLKWAKEDCDKWCAEHNIPDFVKQIMLLKMDTLRDVIRETTAMKDAFYDEKRQIKKRKRDSSRHSGDTHKFNKQLRRWNEKHYS